MQDLNTEFIERVRETHGGERYVLTTHGCQMNEHDSEKIKTLLDTMGLIEIDDEEKADFSIINTCSVRHSAEDKVIGHIGRLKHIKKTNKNLKVAVCGCMMQRKESRDYVLETFPHVNIVFGTNNIYRLPQLILENDDRNSRVVDIEESYSNLDNRIFSEVSGNSAYVNIIYGCNNFCTYCIVPYTRGREISRSPEDIIEEIEALVADGVNEVTLLGQNVNSYGKTLEEKTSFADLLRRVHEIEGIERIQFTTSHPKDMSDDLIACYGELPKLANFLHLPVQAGSNRVLKAMNRHYTREDYFELIDKLRDVRPDIALSTDIMVGFPGETEEDFEDTLDLVRRVRYDSAFTFIYSRREGTRADRMEDQVPKEVKDARFQKLLDEVYRIQREKYEALIGTEQEVLFDSRSKNDETMMSGRTNGFKLVHVPYEGESIGRIRKVKIVGGNTFSLRGEIVHEDN
ncbi:tRNA-i(6)A37 thiotransferase enzyme MiaB [Aedoeadaptatus nemausensis]|uniref:tRNA-2-methylthio-N(6)-dimethylallyladenosine synthase n=1 Tax=Aedoeadaptatus nemausensis TaxID=2582829 RepID=A0A6V6Y0U2_9FIRM|nr:tRNA (N6-isopentenyl adenosine(37)-C2)-methylthiotransferase MiaB [Peptoniphilus nemausensis]CAC9924809.1 tRNA-i(6)A37 thiotransferase enzyme MiaB [Peptoniphilus nemausensis]